MPFNSIRDKINEINEKDDVEDESEDQTLNSLLTPNVWENYMARNTELENLTFSQMVMEYQWCNSLSSVPAYCKKLLQKEYRFSEQWTFSDLNKYRERQDIINDFIESDESKEIRRQQSKI